MCPRRCRRSISRLGGLPYPELAARIVGLFAGNSFGRGELRRLAETAYAGFRHEAVTPLVQLDERLWLLELFHGPTLAFKDLALQLVGLLFDAALARRGERVTIVGATSGDTGSAALEACRGRNAIDIFFLYPHRRISEVQRRQMTTVDAGNAHAIAIEGNFDDCQDIVKALFADTALRRDLSLSAMNSINFARIAAQIVYYVAAGLALGAPERPVSFAVLDRQFRPMSTRRIWRAPWKLADRASRYAGDQRQRHPRALSRGRRHVDRRCQPEPQPEHGHPGGEQFRAAAVRAQGPQRRRGQGDDRRVPP